MKLNYKKLKPIAKKVIWFEKPSASLRNLPKLICYICHYGSLEDILTLLHVVDSSTIKKAIHSDNNHILSHRDIVFINLLL